MNHLKKIYKYLILLMVLSIIPLSKSFAQIRGVHPGLRVGTYSDVGDIFLGGGFTTPLGSRWFLNPNFEYVFSDYQTYATFNGDFDYSIPDQVRNVSFWAGGGLGIIYSNPEGPSGGDTDLGLNLLGGIGIQTGSVMPYIQPKIILKQNSEFVMGFGVRF
ncbi:MAG TPA: hypothetical protein VJ991_07945 [Balneolales bacterium]|nr:hypothetical protein [Balneolales bacterium]